MELQVRPLTESFGVEISGLEPSVPLAPDVLAQIKALFDTKSLLVFRDVEIDREFQYYLSYELVGRTPPQQDPTNNPKRESRVSNKEENGIAPVGRLLWHSDMMWSDEACELLSLYGVEVGQPAPPTLFISAVSGWRTLPAELRSKVEGRTAKHVHDVSYERSGGDNDVLTARFDDGDCARFPIGRAHPRTGQTLLYVCEQMTSEIEDLPKAESDAVLEALFTHLYAPENVLEHEWREKDLVIWDNLALQHSRPNVKADGPPRTLRKTFAPMPTFLKTRTPKFATAGTMD
jgi:taurine dioxygenase